MVPSFNQQQQLRPPQTPRRGSGPRAAGVVNSSPSPGSSPAQQPQSARRANTPGGAERADSSSRVFEFLRPLTCTPPARRDCDAAPKERRSSELGDCLRLDEVSERPRLSRRSGTEGSAPAPPSAPSSETLLRRASAEQAPFSASLGLRRTGPRQASLQTTDETLDRGRFVSQIQTRSSCCSALQSGRREERGLTLRPSEPSVTPARRDEAPAQTSLSTALGALPEPSLQRAAFAQPPLASEAEPAPAAPPALRSEGRELRTRAPQLGAGGPPSRKRLRRGGSADSQVCSAEADFRRRREEALVSRRRRSEPDPLLCTTDKTEASSETSSGLHLLELSPFLLTRALRLLPLSGVVAFGSTCRKARSIVDSFAVIHKLDDAATAALLTLPSPVLKRQLPRLAGVRSLELSLGPTAALSSPLILGAVSAAAEAARVRRSLARERRTTHRPRGARASRGEGAGHQPHHQQQPHQQHEQQHQQQQPTETASDPLNASGLEARGSPERGSSAAVAQNPVAAGLLENNANAGASPEAAPPFSQPTPSRGDSSESQQQRSSRFSWAAALPERTLALLRLTPSAAAASPSAESTRTLGCSCFNCLGKGGRARETPVVPWKNCVPSKAAVLLEALNKLESLSAKLCFDLASPSEAQGCVELLLLLQQVLHRNSASLTNIKITVLLPSATSSWRHMPPLLLPASLPALQSLHIDYPFQVVSGLELSDNFSCCSVQGAHRLSQMRTAAFWREPTAKSARLLSAEERAALASSAADGRASALLLVSEERMLQEKSQAGDIAPLTGPAKSDECGFGGECRGLYVVATACACGGVVKLLSDGRLFFLQKQARTPDPCAPAVPSAATLALAFFRRVQRLGEQAAESRNQRAAGEGGGEAEASRPEASQPPASQPAEEASRPEDASRPGSPRASEEQPLLLFLEQGSRRVGSLNFFLQTAAPAGSPQETASSQAAPAAAETMEASPRSALRPRGGSSLPVGVLHGALLLSLQRLVELAAPSLLLLDIDGEVRHFSVLHENLTFPRLRRLSLGWTVTPELQQLLQLFEEHRLPSLQKLNFNGPAQILPDSYIHVPRAKPRPPPQWPVAVDDKSREETLRRLAEMAAQSRRPEALLEFKRSLLAGVVEEASDATDSTGRGEWWSALAAPLDEAELRRSAGLNKYGLGEIHLQLYALLNAGVCKVAHVDFVREKVFRQQEDSLLRDAKRRPLASLLRDSNSLLTPQSLRASSSGPPLRERLAESQALLTPLEEKAFERDRQNCTAEEAPREETAAAGEVSSPATAERGESLRGGESSSSSASGPEPSLTSEETSPLRLNSGGGGWRHCALLVGRGRVQIFQSLSLSLSTSLVSFVLHVNMGVRVCGPQAGEWLLQRLPAALTGAAVSLNQNAASSSAREQREEDSQQPGAEACRTPEASEVLAAPARDLPVGKRRCSPAPSEAGGGPPQKRRCLPRDKRKSAAAQLTDKRLAETSSRGTEDAALMLTPESSELRAAFRRALAEVAREKLPLLSALVRPSWQSADESPCESESLEEAKGGESQQPNSQPGDSLERAFTDFLLEVAADDISDRILKRRITVEERESFKPEAPGALFQANFANFAKAGGETAGSSLLFKAPKAKLGLRVPELLSGDATAPQSVCSHGVFFKYAFVDLDFASLLCFRACLRNHPLFVFHREPTKGLHVLHVDGVFDPSTERTHERRGLWKDRLTYAHVGRSSEERQTPQQTPETPSQLRLCSADARIPVSAETARLRQEERAGDAAAQPAESESQAQEEARVLRLLPAVGPEMSGYDLFRLEMWSCLALCRDLCQPQTLSLHLEALERLWEERVPASVKAIYEQVILPKYIQRRMLSPELSFDAIKPWWFAHREQPPHPLLLQNEIEGADF